MASTIAVIFRGKFPLNVYSFAHWKNLTSAVRETSISRQNEGPTEAPPETPRTITALSWEVFKGGP